MEHAILKAACAIGAGLCMGIGAIGPGVGEGNAVITETTGIFSLLISFLILFALK